MWKKLSKLIDVKSIVTLELTTIFCILSYKGDIKAEQFMLVFGVVIAFYYGTQKAKNSVNGGVENDE